jgi:hypothetical protein
MKINICLCALLWSLVVLPGPVGAIPHHRGISYTPWDNDLIGDPWASTALEESLDDLARTGANWTALNIFEFQQTLSSTQIAPRLDKYSTDAASIEKAVNELHDRGINVLLKPNVDVADGQCRGFIPDSPDWFAGYRDFIYGWAEWAENHGVGALSVGTEFRDTVDAETSWKQVISGIRARYSGPLVYAANWDSYRNVGWWNALDFIGIDAYFPLTSQLDPTAGELLSAWNSRADQIEAWLASLPPGERKPVLFTEIGYRSLDGANKAPYAWSEYTTMNVDLQEQADCYRAAFEATWDRPWMAGYDWWNWETNPLAGIDPDTGLPLNDYTPQNKPAVDVLRARYIPEPSCLVLLCLGLAAACARTLNRRPAY